MAKYLISYDVRTRPGHSYQPLYDQLNAWSAAHLQNSVWLAELNGTASEVRALLLKHMHNDDTLCVIQLTVGSNWATQNAKPTGNAWLRANISM
jgi:CRISPR/Cas system-associated endoribonuclease Cas2